jgi:uncharacterized protein GlcG (DUF336 family)
MMTVSRIARVVTALVLWSFLLAFPQTARAQLTAADVDLVIRTAASAIDSTTAVIAVTDREGIVLGVFRKLNGSAADADLAVSLARTGAFFSNDEAPLSSRTVRFISGRNFIPGVANTGASDLWDIENTNRGCPLSRSYNPGQEISPSRRLNGGTGIGITTGKVDLADSSPLAVNPGGVPIFKSRVLVGGIGVAGVPAPVAEFAAFAGSTPGAPFGPAPAPPGKVVLEGVDLPFVVQRTAPPGTGPGDASGDFIVTPRGSARAGVPSGYLVGPLGSPELSPADVDRIVQQSNAAALRTRAAIRLPPGRPTRMVIAVSDLQGNQLAIFRMPDSTIFSIDVAATKARNMVYFSSRRLDPRDLPGVPPGTAVTNRTISFGAQPFYPPGIDLGIRPGPFFDLLVRNAARPCTQGFDQENRQNQSGIVFFPGSAPLYRDGQLIGGLGISGDGVSQDDVVTEAGTRGFEAPSAIRADQIIIQGIRLPYFKFIRNPRE